jgi:hypothetical protein
MHAPRRLRRMAGTNYSKHRLSRRLIGVVALLMSIATTVAAQSITDARRVEFTPSADHNAVEPTSGIALVNSYTLDVFVAGGTALVQTANLGKPAPDADGMIRVDFVSLLPSPLTAGVIYEAVVNAVGPGGTTAGSRSNTFSFSLSCAPTISPTSQSPTATGGSLTVTVSAAAGCVWAAVSNDAWITVTTGATGAGPGSVTLSVAANTGTASRTGTVTIGANTFTVTQAGTACSFTLSPTSQSFAAAGGSTTVNVTTSASCGWSATSGSAWVTISNGTARTGSGSVGITAASNSTTQSRTATLTIAGKSFVVTEQAATCTYTVAPLTVTVPPTGGSGTITVTTLSTCAWTSTSGTSWITLTGSSTGSGSASYTIGANTGTASRTANVTVAGVSVRLNQGAVTPPVAPSNLRFVR